jgi:DNA-binding transcriptional ArsR family regulator
MNRRAIWSYMAKLTKPRTDDTRNRQPSATASLTSGRWTRRCRLREENRVGAGRMILAGLVTGSVLGAGFSVGGSAELSSATQRLHSMGEAPPKAVTGTALGRARTELRPPIAYEAAGPPPVARSLSRSRFLSGRPPVTRRHWICVGGGRFRTTGARRVESEGSQRHSFRHSLTTSCPRDVLAVGMVPCCGASPGGLSQACACGLPAVDSFTRLMWWLLSSSTGARKRAEIVKLLREQPRNARQIAIALSVDYTTARHHLRVLQQNRLVESTGDHYGQVYAVSPLLESRWDEYERIMGRQRMM